MIFSKKLWKDFTHYDNILCVIRNIESYGVCKMNYTFNKTDISNGIELCEISAEGFKSACVSVSFVLPLCEKASLYALVPNVLCRSSAMYPDITSIERKLASLYGAEVGVDVSKSGENQVIKIAVSCIDDRFALDGEVITAECSKLLFELVFNPKTENGVFCTDDVESEKRLLIERLYAEVSDKRVYAKNRCEEIMFANEAYGIHRLGNVDSIKKISPDTLFEAYTEILRTAKICVAVSGNTDSSLVRNELEKHISKIRRNVNVCETLFVERAEDVLYEREQEEVKQGKLVMGFRMGMTSANDDYAPRRVMVDLFGGSPHSKLFTNVREKMSLCYYCSARMFKNKGIMLVQSGIESENEEKSKNAILDQLDDIKNGIFTQEDIDASIKALEDGFKSVTDSPEMLDSWFMSQCIDSNYLYPEQYVEAFKKVTKQDIIKAANDVTLDTVFMLEGTLKDGE